MKNVSLHNSHSLRGQPVLLRLSLMFLLAFFVTTLAHAQTSITGSVTDENGVGMPGVNIIVKATTNGTTSDSDGKFALSVQENDAVLVFSFIGYETQEIPLNGQTSVSLS